MDGVKTGREAIAQVLRARGDDGGEGGALQMGCGTAEESYHVISPAAVLYPVGTPGCSRLSQQ
jgi:hypothetical protein